jgi:methylated-DNA-[protein]-cysteine S-methyltransferase
MTFKPLKKTLRQLLEDGKLEEIVEMSDRRRKVLGTLVALTFDADLKVAWRAIEAQGMAAEELSQVRPGQVKDHMRKLYWLITEESGAVFWRAPECMAECGARLPALLSEFVPIAFHLLETLEDEDLEHFRPGAVYAVARLAGVVGDELESMIPLVVDALKDPLPQSRGMAVWCLGRIGRSEALEGRGELLEDEGPVSLYRNREIEHLTVADLTREVLAEVAPA